MANNVQSSTVYIDTNSAQVYAKKALVAYVIYTSSGAGDQIVLRDGNDGSDPIKLSLKVEAANSTQVFDFSRKPIIFQDGIYVSALSASSVATIVLTSGDK